MIENIGGVMIFLFLLSLMPLFILLTTSFVKIAVVLILTRESLGVQQVPPNIVVYGLSLVLSLYVMGPVYNNSYKSFKRVILTNTKVSGPDMIKYLQLSVDPVKLFLRKHTSALERVFFYNTLHKYWTHDMMRTVTKNDLIILIPAFMVHELSGAFKIGFLIYLPSVIIDIVVSNILMAMGMMMMSPVTISLPVKLMLFIALDGFPRIIHILVLTY